MQRIYHKISSELIHYTYSLTECNGSVQMLPIDIFPFYEIKALNICFYIQILNIIQNYNNI